MWTRPSALGEMSSLPKPLFTNTSRFTGLLMSILLSLCLTSKTPGRVEREEDDHADRAGDHEPDPTRGSRGRRRSCLVGHTRTVAAFRCKSRWCQRPDGGTANRLVPARTARYQIPERELVSPSRRTCAESVTARSGITSKPCPPASAQLRARRPVRAARRSDRAGGRRQLPHQRLPSRGQADPSTARARSQSWRWAGGRPSCPGSARRSRARSARSSRTERSTLWPSASSAFRPGSSRFLRLPGIGPKTAARFWRELGLTTLEQLRRAAEAGAAAHAAGDRRLARGEGAAGARASRRAGRAAGCCSARRCRGAGAVSPSWPGCRG